MKRRKRTLTDTALTATSPPADRKQKRTQNTETDRSWRSQQPPSKTVIEACRDHRPQANHRGAKSRRRAGGTQQQAHTMQQQQPRQHQDAELARKNT
jgi:hypothetical protein